MNPNLEAVMTAARAGGAVVKKYFGAVLRVEEKSNAGDLRTKADVESERAILSVLQQAFPSFSIYAEESGQVRNESAYTFVVDPLDGTNNFVLGIPYFTISVGLLKNNEVVLGVVYDPILDHMYAAQKGGGAYLNNRRIHVNNEVDITRATVSYTCGYNTVNEYSDRVKQELQSLYIKRCLETWSPSHDYCLLASGRIEAVISKEGSLEDYVAAKIIIAEAGGLITSFTNETAEGRDADFVASNGTRLHDQLLASSKH